MCVRDVGPDTCVCRCSLLFIPGRGPSRLSHLDLARRPWRWDFVPLAGCAPQGAWRGLRGLAARRLATRRRRPTLDQATSPPPPPSLSLFLVACLSFREAWLRDPPTVCQGESVSAGGSDLWPGGGSVGVVGGTMCKGWGASSPFSRLRGPPAACQGGVLMPGAKVLLWGPLLWCCQENRGFGGGVALFSSYLFITD